MAGLQDVWGLGGYLQRRGQIEDSETKGIQQATGLMGLLQAAQAQQRQQAGDARSEKLRGVLSQAKSLEEAIPMLLREGPEGIGLASKLAPVLEAQRKAALPQAGQPIGSGGLLRPDGTIIPPAARPETGGPRPPPIRTRVVGEMQVQEEMGPDGAWKEVGRGPRFARQIAPVINVGGGGREPAVTPVTIQDPNDPSGTIIIDGRSGRLLGKGPKMTEAGKIDAKTNLTMTGLGADLQSAEDLLTGVTRTSDGQVVKGNKPTGSGIGAAYDAAAGFFGATPAGAAEADSLKVVAARLTQRIPRFEGPQSDKDLALYKQAAGDVGNEKLPIPRRLAAAKTMRSLYAGYESGQRGRLIGNRRAADQGSGAAPKVVDFNSLPE